jgi:transcriptional regulator with XRE-family HTH domain
MDFCEELLTMNIEQRKRLGERIAQLRGRLSQRQFASEVLDCSYSALRSYELGETIPGLELMEKLASLMETDLTTLIAEVKGELPVEKTINYYLSQLVLLPIEERIALATELLNSVKHFSSV